MIGQTISHYKITAKLGEGGMGVVYQATDTRLGREVALKILPEKFVQDRQRMSRFQREAEILASLNHPHISIIYGLEEADGVRALVLELVEGPTLAERIAEGPIPVEETLQIALEITQALEAAYEKGIIHRDLKPANVKITPEGKVKVLDFGLAKALEPELSQQELANSPTLTMEATQEGVVLGTAAYMSPEQARGRPVDTRTDIWAFGCVLFECLTGKQEFGGEKISDSIAKILQKDPEWEVLPKGTPWRVRDLLRRCLEKDAHERLHHIADARIEIKYAFEQPSDDPYGEVETATPTRWQQPIPLAALGLLIALVGVLLGPFLWNPGNDSQPASPSVTRFRITLPDDEVIPGGASVALSPDGTQLVYAAIRDNTSRLYRRSLNELEASEIPGTEGGLIPFFSPNGQWVGFFQDLKKLKKWSVLGGEPLTICEVGQGRGASWGEDDTIIFGKNPGLWRVPSAGDTQELVSQGEGAGGYFYPQILPGGRGVLFLELELGKGTRVGVLSLETGQHKILVPGGSKARYLSTGHLVYGLGGSVLAAPFDLDSLELLRPGVPVVEGVWLANGAVSKFEVSQNGSLVYVSGSDVLRKDALVWVDLRGQEQSFLPTEMELYLVRLSPDGKRLAVQAREEDGSYKLWTCEIDLCVFSPLTSGAAPVWSRDSSELFFFGVGGNIWRISTDDSVKLERVFERELNQFPHSVSADGTVLAFTQAKAGSVKDILTLRLDDSAKVEAFHVSDFNETDPVFSPDGNWIAFTSNRSGKDEVYLKSYPSAGRPIPITTKGGNRPIWSPDGKEIFYRNGAKLMAVPVQMQPDLRPGKSRELFEGTVPNDQVRRYDLTPDGRKFLMIKEGQQKSAPAQINVVLNWSEELKRLVPTDD